MDDCGAPRAHCLLRLALFFSDKIGRRCEVYMGRRPGWRYVHDGDGAVMGERRRVLAVGQGESRRSGAGFVNDDGAEEGAPSPGLHPRRLRENR